jgi:hypothetical protein
MAAPPVLTTFSGPLTPVAINEWLLGCEKKFLAWESQNSKSLTEVVKVQLGGNHISADSATDDLKDWWNEADPIATWAEFKDLLKLQALGPDWRARALESFYTTKQDDKNVDTYIKSLEEKRSVIKNAAGSFMPVIDDSTFKCYMLFNANPALTAKLMNVPGYDILTDTALGVKQKLLKQASSVSRPGPIVPTSSLSGVHGYLLLDQWGNPHSSTGSGFTDLGSLPAEAKSLGDTKTVTIWSNSHSTKYMIQRYQFASGSTTVANPPDRQSTSDSRTLNLVNGEYITSVAITATKYEYRQGHFYYDSNVWSVSSMTITTSSTPPQTASLDIGAGIAKTSQPPQKMTFTAPSGWRVVGFRGTTSSFTDHDIPGSTAYPIVGLGAILAPVKA